MSKDKLPKVSIIMPVKNCEKFIVKSLESILCQSLENFELLIFNDKSTDDTLNLIHSFKDRRITVYNETKGLINNLNKGLSISKAKFIARMDGDDIMYKDRLLIQFNTMVSIPQIDICGTGYRFIGDDFEPKIKKGYEGRILAPIMKMIVQNFIAHPTVMLRKEFFMTNNLRYIDFKYAEDFRLWFEAAKLGARFYIIGEPLLDYRISSTQTTALFHSEMRAQTIKIQKEAIEFLLGLPQFQNQTPCCTDLFTSLKAYEERGLITFDKIQDTFYQLFYSLIKGS
ncbi:hypothetical protein CPT03_02280 [Pedobacter ginsengisoli]|uniref:Glycosyltransferase 2-like domain-containing protein n=1 Tax=Pedobacter ginsengisoli TaxID=363852 RepID=A0A2D1U193_9SPHI|nr:glycosyltransferase [Pedobacter ginsengisoli]ATP55373.1 hypothetical protein CPT03_02280 [Pedobacter ginsengisoli]